MQELASMQAKIAPKTKQWQERWCTFCKKQGHTVEFCWAKTSGQGKGQVAEGKGKGKKGERKVGFRLARDYFAVVSDVCR